MKTIEEIITPDKAKKYLATITSPEQQRKHSETVSDTYADAMKAGHWLFTHQGIGFDDSGILIDGQHRLWAIVKSNIPQRMLVTRGIASKVLIAGPNGELDLFSIDCLDRGKTRTVVDQMKMRHGVKNANAVVAAARQLLLIACDRKLFANSVPTTMATLAEFGESIGYVVENSCNLAGFRIAAANAVLALYIHSDRERGTKFFHEVHQGENIKRGNPSFAFRDYLMKGRMHIGTTGGYSLSKHISMAAAGACMHHYQGNEITVIRLSENGLEWLLKRNEKSIAKVRKAINL